LKYYRPDGNGNLRATVNAIKYATDLKLDFINYSGGGADPNVDEYYAIEQYVNGGGTILVAAGNDGKNLDNPENGFYPAKYAVHDKRIIVVGLLNDFGIISTVSNYGSFVTRWEKSVNAPGFGHPSGTSLATAVATGKEVAKNKKRREACHY
jgi:hypothetical protein